MREELLWLALHLVAGVGPRVFRALLSEFGDVRAVFDASYDELAAVRGLSQETARSIKGALQSARFKSEQAAIARLGAKIVTLGSPEYPENLRHIPSPPPVLYVLGTLEAKDSFAISVVGTRTPTHYGRRTAEELAAELASMGLTVVSGLARGIDSCAHRGALNANGRTIAVLGSGLEHIYPAEHKPLAEKIAASGAVVTELPTDARPEPRNFPIRNRIISGLSLGTVVVEAGPTSGALITASRALEQGREVFAVPGNIKTEKSRGTNRLIRQGAKLVVSAKDIVEEIAPELKGMLREETTRKAAEARLNLEPYERKIYETLSHEPIHIDEITLATALPQMKINVGLFNLQMKGLAKELPGKLFVRTL